MAARPSNVSAVQLADGVRVRWDHPGDTRRGFRIDVGRKSSGVWVENDCREAIVPGSRSGLWSVLAVYNTPPDTPLGVINLRSEEVPLTSGAQPAPQPVPGDKPVLLCDHSTGDLSQWPHPRIGQRKPYSHNVVRLDGGQAARFEVREGQAGLDAFGNPKKVRAEVGDLSVPDDSEWWYAWRTRIDPAWADNGKPFYTIAQFHQTPPPDADGWGPPPLGFSYSQNQWRIWQWFYAGDHVHGPLYEAPGAKGVWVSWRVHANWASPGLLEIWRDGKRVVSLSGKVCNRESRSGPFFKCGIYRGPGDPNTQILYHDDYRRGLTRESVA